ncbi:MAG TPA: hypothetical protein DCF33_20900, partial [Saprospirales bacterium]|nr:hypothetical protein [Saprospirales bacterium]
FIRYITKFRVLCVIRFPIKIRFIRVIRFILFLIKILVPIRVPKNPRSMHNTNAVIDFRGHIPALDGVRGIAILTVLLSHFLTREYFSNERTFYIVQNGWMGVDLFFVLSGFLITGILLDSREKPNYWQKFYKNRALRILPLYYFVVLVTWLTILYVEKAPERLQGYDSFVWFFTFTPNIAM